MNERTKMPAKTAVKKTARKAAASPRQEPAAEFPPLSAACDSDDLMNKPQTVPLSGAADTAAWPSRIAAAMERWRRLNAHELTATEDDEEKLARLVARRYILARTDAVQQVRDFLGRGGT